MLERKREGQQELDKEGFEDIGGEVNLYIYTSDIKNLLKRSARSLILAYLLLLILTMWGAESAYLAFASFQQDCEGKGGFITLTDNVPSCTRIRKIHGFFQL